MRTISIEEIRALMEKGVSTFSRKDTSVRGIETVYAGDIQAGDKIVIDNYFTLVVETRNED